MLFRSEHAQLFCTDSAQDIIDVLVRECERAGVRFAHPCAVESVARREGGFSLATGQGRLECASLVVATGGLAVPQLGASAFGYRLAEQFGLAVVAPKPALVPLALAPEQLEPLKPLSGVAFETTAQAGASPAFRESALITHRGLSGPSILQVSSYWQQAGGREAITLDLLPGEDVEHWVASKRRSHALPANVLGERLPKRFAQAWCALQGFTRPMDEMSGEERLRLARALGAWSVKPSGTLGYAKAEVTLGGVDTDELSSKSMEAKRVPGLYFIGEVVDVTGWLGGFNFQWAWSSGWVAGQFA